jgi:hypothetical protein
LPNGEAFVVSLDCCIFLVMVVRKHEAMSFIDNRSTIGIPCVTLGWHRSVQKLILGTDRTRTRGPI